MRKRYACVVEPYQLEFEEVAITSRGRMTHRDILLIEISDNFGRTGVGEIAPLKGLSLELERQFEEKVNDVCENITHYLENLDNLAEYPSILFGVETAWLAYKNTNSVFFKTPFTQYNAPIPINGLVWMGDQQTMKARIDHILSQRPTCIKLKIGGINWDQEIELIKYIRSQSAGKTIDIRLDANGAFEYKDWMTKSKQLEPYQIHSVEQPLSRMDPMYPKLASESWIPIALDEELIGHYTYKDRYKLLHNIQPQYIVLKPSLHGGLRGCEEWIFVAAQLNIKWWATSALESNLGLNAIAQWASQYKECYTTAQGLGTGKLYKNNIGRPLNIDRYQISFSNTNNVLS